jgi:hypothetical protein
MKTILDLFRISDATLMGARVLIAALLPTAALAFPPAPYHLIYGLARDQYGTPLSGSGSQVVLETPAGLQLVATISPGLAPGINYQLKVPMDAGVTPDLYQASALPPSAPFTLMVVMNQTTNLPIQMVGDLSHLGLPGQRTRLDLTLGVDANGDGLPDAWELAFLAAIGSKLPLSDLNAGMILTPDGLTLLQQFLLGNYPFDPTNSFTVTLVGIQDGGPLLEFTTMTGRSYTVLGSPDLQQWTPLSFLVPANGPGSSPYSFLYAPNISTVQIQALQPASGPVMNFFRIMLQ